MSNALMLALVGSLALAGFHGLTALLRAMPDRHLATFNSVAAGAGLAYVFLYLLFELATEGAPKIHELVPLGPGPLETLYIFLLGALSATYVVQLHFEKTPSPVDDHRGFALMFITYNVLAGAGLLEEASWGALNLAFYVAAIGLHLLFNDLFLLHRYPTEHTLSWRVALGIAPVCGYGLATALGVPAGVLYIALAIVAGGTITNVLRRELPEALNFRPLAFIAGVVVYATLIFATWRF